MKLTRQTGRPIEAKAVAGPSVTALAGYIAWAILTFWPAARNAIPVDVQGQLPVVIAAILSAVAAYFAPHTSRPDLPGPELPVVRFAPSAPTPVGPNPGQPGQVAP